jgi:flagellar biosynthetic protein FlhB
LAGERTEAPSQRKLKDARRRGQVVRSQELVSVGVLLGAVIALRAFGPGLWNGMAAILTDGLQARPHGDLTPQSSLAIGRDMMGRALLLLAPFLGVIALAGIILNVGQSGLAVSGTHLRPKLKNISPSTGAKRIVSMTGLVNFGKSIGKLATIALVVGLTMRSQFNEISSLGQFQVAEAAGGFSTLAFDIALRAAAVLFFIGVLDFAWQRRKFFRDLMMTKEEVRQEMKESDGDPQIKAAIRRRRQQLMNRMVAQVPTADVVVMNPTHYAVAIKYDAVTMGAPIVVAKGERLLALRIKEVALKAGVPVLQEPPLARALFKAVPIGHPIPANLYRAVAEVLAWVYALRAKRPARRPSIELATE